MAGTLVIRPNEQDEIATCSCCAGNPGVSGFVYDGETPLAVYFAEPIGMINYPMLRLGIAIGRWGGESVAADRLRAVFSCRPGPQLELVDPFLPTVPELAALGQGLFPAAAEDHPQLAELRAVAAAIIEEDPRLADMRNERRAHRFAADVVPESGAGP
jgi:hypothetical protein